MHPPIFPVTQKLLREVSTASARTDGTRTYTLKNLSCYYVLYVVGYIYVSLERERKLKGNVASGTNILSNAKCGHAGCELLSQV